MPVSVLIFLGCAVLLLIARQGMPKRAARIVGVGALIFGFGELMSGGDYAGLVGATWLMLGLMYLLFSIPAVTEALWGRTNKS